MVATGALPLVHYDRPQHLMGFSDDVLAPLMAVADKSGVRAFGGLDRVICDASRHAREIVVKEVFVWIDRGRRLSPHRSHSASGSGDLLVTISQFGQYVYGP